MIGKESGELVVTCDDCGDTHYGGTLEFRDLIDQIKGEGWKCKKDGEQWIHTCPDCLAE